MIKYKNFQPKANKPNLKSHKKDHTSQSSGIFPRDARVVPHLQIKTHHKSHQQNE